MTRVHNLYRHQRPGASEPLRNQGLEMSNENGETHLLARVNSLKHCQRGSFKFFVTICIVVAFILFIYRDKVQSRSKDGRKTGSNSNDHCALGRTGNGKSSTGNTILKMKAFKESSGSSSCSKLIKDAENVINNVSITVYDTPGLFDGDDNDMLTAEERAVVQMDSLMYACQKSGVNAFVLVLNATNRFTEEEKKTVQWYEAIFGADFLKKNGILALTHADNIGTENKDTDLKDWTAKQTGAMKTLIEKFEGRIAFFENIGNFEGRREKSGVKLRDLCQQKLELNAYSMMNYKNNVSGRNRFKKILDGVALCKRFID